MQISGDPNRFLSLASTIDQELLRPSMMAIEMHAGQCLYASGHEVRKVFFPHSGVVVMTMSIHNRPAAGIVLIGNDGVIGGLSATACAPANCNAEVLISGRATWIPAVEYRFALAQSAAISNLAARFDNALMAQAQQTALCNATHHVQARFCRWLLEIYDRTGSTIPLKQATLGRMLGVRRTTVTMVSVRLEKDGVLRSRRGSIEIMKRDDLERHCCECYQRAKSFAKTVFVAGDKDQSLATANAAAAPVSTSAVRQ